MKLIEYPSRQALFAGLAGVIVDDLRRALASGPVTLSVPGGTTPGPVFDLLCDADIDWRLVSIVLNDERWVDETNPRSNTRLLRERLMQKRAAKAHLVPLFAAHHATPEAALPELTTGLLPHLPITVLVLGMGNDMHTASLFPGADRLDEALSPTASPLLPLRATGAGEPRITLTAPVLRAARHIHVLITGAEKRAALDRAATLPLAMAPIGVVLMTATVHWAE